MQTFQVFAFWHISYLTCWPCRAGGETCLSQEPDQPSSLSLPLSPSRQFYHPAAQHFVSDSLAVPSYLKNTSFTALIFSKPLVTFFLTVPETLMLGRKLGVQDTYMLLLVGAISGKMIKTTVIWISNFGVIHLKENFIFWWLQLFKEGSRVRISYSPGSWVHFCAPVALWGLSNSGQRPSASKSPGIFF